MLIILDISLANVIINKVNVLNTCTAINGLTTNINGIGINSEATNNILQITNEDIAMNLSILLTPC